MSRSRPIGAFGLAVVLSLWFPAAEAAAHGVTDLGEGVVVSAHGAVTGMVRPSVGGVSLGAGVSVSRFWPHPSREGASGLFLWVSSYAGGTKLSPLRGSLGEQSWRPEGGFRFRLGFRVGFFELGGGLVGPDRGLVARAMLGVWLPNVVSVSAGIASIDRTPFATAALTVGFGKKL
jgi:hypothetical protein